MPGSAPASAGGGTRSSARASAVAASPAPGLTSTEMIGVPTSAVTPSGTSSAATTPSNGLGSSTTAFAVSISTMIWLTVTRSPGWTCHLTMSASVRPSPTSGSLNCLSSAIPASSVGEGAVDADQHPVQVRQIVLLDPGGRVRGGITADPQHRRLQVVEALLGHPRGDLGAEAAADRRLV